MSDLDNKTRTMVAIGTVCSRWADIEFIITELIHAVIVLLDPAFKKATVKGAVEIIVTHADIRDRISMAKVLATQASLGRKLYRRLETQLNHIDNDLRLERNRFVHDEWLVTKTGALRTCVRPKVVKQQAFKLDMVFATSKAFTIEEVEEFALDLSRAIGKLMQLIWAIEELHPKRRRVKSPPPTPKG